MQLRSFCFTLHKHTPEELEVLLNLPYKYVIYGIELGESGETPHLQGYMELEKRVTISKVKSLLPRLHFEPRKGTQLQAINYCKKEGRYVELGECKDQGFRTDLYAVRDHLKSGRGLKSLIENDGIIINVNTLRTAEKLIRYYDKPRDFKPDVLWFYGPSGTGKTRAAVECMPNAYFYSNSTGKWWSGYDGEQDVIIDDIRPASINFMQLIGLLDRYPYQVEDKGTIRQFRGRRIIITAPLGPRDMYYEDPQKVLVPEDIQQLLRRIDNVIYFS